MKTRKSNSAFSIPVLWVRCRISKNAVESYFDSPSNATNSKSVFSEIYLKKSQIKNILHLGPCSGWNLYIERQNKSKYSASQKCSGIGEKQCFLAPQNGLLDITDIGTSVKEFATLAMDTEIFKEGQIETYTQTQTHRLRLDDRQKRRHTDGDRKRQENASTGAETPQLHGQADSISDDV